MWRRVGNAVRPRVGVRLNCQRTGLGSYSFRPQAASHSHAAVQRSRPDACVFRQRRRQAICNRSARGQRRGCCYQVISNLRLPGSRGLPDTFFRPLPPCCSYWFVSTGAFHAPYEPKRARRGECFPATGSCGYRAVGPALVDTFVYYH